MSRKRNQNKAKPEHPAHAEPRRFPVWAIGLVVAPLVLYGGWHLFRGPAEVKQTEASADNTNADDSKETVSETTTTSDATTDRVPTNEVSVQAPGATQQSYVAPLADAYRRIDPAADGWETEAFNEASNQQLKNLGKLFEESPDKSKALPDKLVTDEFVCSPLHPAMITKVFEDATLQVERAESLGAVNSTAGNLRGPHALQSAIGEFRRLYRNGVVERTKLKPVTISTEGDKATTTIYFQSVGESESGTLQVNAKWTLDWSTATAVPKLLSLKVTDYERVVHRGHDGKMFSDCTASVLGNTFAYNQQFLRSTDYWRARLARDLGLDPVANHGLAIGDVNGDQLEDLYVCQQGGLPNRLFIQNADGTLRDATSESGADWLDYCASALFVDFDNDGDRDLVIAQEWRILLMSNDGQGHFQIEFGTSSEAQSFSISASDYDLDGDVDVYACGYNPPASSVRQGAMGEPVPYHDANNGGKNMLLRNDGNWLFTDVTSEVGLDQNNSRYSFAAAWEDYDNDGDPDLYVANDYGRNNLYRNDNGRFTDVAPELNVEDMSAGMSANWADVNRDGRMDLYVSNMFSAAGNRITYQRQFKTSVDSNVREQFQRHARGNTLFINAKEGFRDVSVQAGVTMGRWAWGSRFADLNGDGWDDLIVANGFITAEDTGDL
ncbi:MAG: VCBS repeat-containing protein [Planctomycetales bacterium]|nr:VCBS repeat-containing protein [Planctomycetales bacterium]